MPGYVTRLCQELAKQGRTQDEDRERIAKNMEKQDQLNAHKFTVFSDKMNRVLEQQEASHRELQAQQQKMMAKLVLQQKNVFGVPALAELVAILRELS